VKYASQQDWWTWELLGELVRDFEVRAFFDQFRDYRYKSDHTQFAG